VWAHYSCYESTLIVLALMVNTHLAEVLSLSISVRVVKMASVGLRVGTL
jgi:hypothetical protein